MAKPGGKHSLGAHLERSDVRRQEKRIFQSLFINGTPSQYRAMNRTTTLMSGVALWAVLFAFCLSGTSSACDSCGRECASACGTRSFRTCCFNYLRKRSSPSFAIVPQQQPALALGILDDFDLGRLPQARRRLLPEKSWLAPRNQHQAYVEQSVEEDGLEHVENL
ncbi:uncharacterized protein Trissin [Hetaerina americana]|uniref:uncharacterized protein Trissin n=1 Tax=Hetaerina americana TaxID=62018 RepID=UPI003A7F5C23